MKKYSGFKVLIVDDNPHNLFTLRTLIKQSMDIEILEAQSGQQALDIAFAIQAIDLIILDIQMPEMDGFEVGSMLKIRQRTKNIPIIFLTAAFKSAEFQQKGYEVGAVDYLLKPIDDLLLINKISTYFRLIEKERHLNEQLEIKVKERTKALNQANKQLENIIQNMGEALLVLSPLGKITQANPEAYYMLGYQTDDLIGMNIGDVFQEELNEQAEAFMGTWLEAVIRTGALSRIDACFVTKTGKKIPILFSRTAIMDEQNNIESIICIAKNMTGYIKVEHNTI